MTLLETVETKQFRKEGNEVFVGLVRRNRIMRRKEKALFALRCLLCIFVIFLSTQSAQESMDLYKSTYYGWDAVKIESYFSQWTVMGCPLREKELFKKIVCFYIL